MLRSCLASISLNLVLLAAPSLQAAEKPAPIKNVLFLISDDLRANTLGCYGDKFCQTPNIDKLAASGMLFERAYCQGTVCGPSRTSFMHSRYRGSDNITLGQHFKDKGFYSARVGKIFHMRVPGDIIAGTDGNDIPACWTEKFNSRGRSACHLAVTLGKDDRRQSFTKAEFVEGGTVGVAP